MLKTQLLHGEILAILGRSGHGSKVLVADGNFPFLTTLGPHARLVPLNLSPGVVSCTQVLQALVSVIPVEAAAVMQVADSGPYAMGEDPPVWSEYRRILRNSGWQGELEPVERFAFYELAAGREVALTVATADQRLYANLMLTIGVVKPEQAEA